MNMLVTGGTGFLGKKLAYRLKGLNHNVRVIGRNEKIGSKLEENGISFIQADFTDKDKIIDSCKDIDFVFHCGALSSPWGKFEDYYNANVRGTANVIEGCKIHNVTRLIHVSTPSIYFSFDERLNVKEDDVLPETFVNYYAHTKFLAEKEIDKAWTEGLPVITIRPRALFGPEDNAIIPRLIRANQKRFIPLINNGKTMMDLTYVENVVDALLLCMDSKPETLGQKYNITNGEKMFLLDVLEKLFKGINQPFKTRKVSFNFAFKLAHFLEWYAHRFKRGKEPVLTKYTVSVLGKSQTLSIEKARKELGYQPKISIDEGIKEFIQWWREQNEH